MPMSSYKRFTIKLAEMTKQKRHWTHGDMLDVLREAKNIIESPLPEECKEGTCGHASDGEYSY